MCVLFFFDDILVHGATFEAHLIHLQAVLQLLLENQW
jgi:hypothetical protein